MNIFKYFNGIYLGDVIYKHDSTLGPLVQPDLQMVWVQAGEIEVRREDAVFHLPPGTLTVQLPGQHIHYRFEAGTRHAWGNVFHPVLNPGIESWLRACPPVAELTQDMCAVETLLREKIWDTHPRQQGVREHLLFTLLAAFLRETGFSRDTAPPMHPAVESATGWALRHLHEPLTLPDLARRAGISPAHLIRLFKRDLGYRPMEWVWEQRCRTAADNLRDTGLGIKEIAYRCGFPTPQHFSRRFRKYSGLSPTAHRMAVRGNGKRSCT